MNGNRSPLANIPTVTKNLLLINGGMFALAFLFESMNQVDLNSILGLYYFDSPKFQPFQIITHMFMHGGMMHIIFNMYALWMFGQILEKVWGPKRFFIYYMITGLGAAVLHSLVNYIHVQSVLSALTPENAERILNEGQAILLESKNYTDPVLAKINIEIFRLINVPVVGASGAVFGLLLGFGMLFPNTKLMLMFIPVPIKAKYFVMGYGAIELINGIANTQGDNIAHFAHIGGMLFGFIMIKLWQKDQRNFQ